MFGGKVFLTYKRRRLSSGTTCFHGKVCSNSPSEGPKNPLSVTSDKHDEMNTSETRKRRLTTSLECVLCGFMGNLLHCEDCHRPYHLLCLNQPRKHCYRGRRLRCGCIKQNSSIPQPIRKSSRLKAKLEGPHTGVHSLKLHLIRNKGLSERDMDGPSFIATSLKNNSSHIQVDSKLDVNSGSAFNNITSGLVSASQPLGMDGEKNVEFDSFTLPLERTCSSSNHNGSFVLEKPNLEDNSLHSKAESANLCGDSFVRTKLTPPLITFSRRSKRKRDVDGAGTVSTLMLKEKNIACEETYCKGFSVNGAADLKASGRNLDMGHKNQDKIKEVGSTYSHAGCALQTKSLQYEGEEQSCVAENISKDASPIDGLVGWGSKISTAVQAEHSNCCLQTSLIGAVNGSFESTIKDKESDNPKFSSGTGEESQVLLSNGVKSGREKVTLPCLNMLPSSPDSCGMLDCNNGLDSDSQKNPIQTDSEGPPELLDSTNGSHVIALQETSPLGMNEATNKRIGESLLMPHEQLLRSTCLCMEVDASCKDNVKVSPMLSVDITLKNNQLQPEATACSVSDERELLYLRKDDNQPKQTSISSSFLVGLSLPAEPKIGGYILKDSSASLSSFYSSSTREFGHDSVHQYLSNQTSVLRRKLMLDNIVCQARDLTGSFSFQEKFNRYPIIWLEEELDSLWIGVRRYGRDWNAILMDPRLHFSSWRVARDLAERWEEEQSKLMNGTRIYRGNIMDNRQLSLGDVYTRREHNLPKRVFPNSRNILNRVTEQFQTPLSYTRIPFDRISLNNSEGIDIPRGDSSSTDLAAKGNLPHWLREAVNTPSRPVEPTPPASIPSSTPSRFDGTKVCDLQPSSSSDRSNHTLAMKHKTAKAATVTCSEHVSRPDDMIVIDSDASSEQTISDDHRARL